MEYYTHQKFLDFYLKNTTGDILELGTGFGSMDIISKYRDNRRVISVDNNKEWIEKTKEKYPETENHKYIYTDNWNEIIYKLADHKWSVVFIDQSPWEARVLSYCALKDTADYIIIHDVDYFPERGVFGKKLGSENFDFSAEFKKWKLYYPEKPYPAPTGPPTLIGTNKDEFIEYK